MSLLYLQTVDKVRSAKVLHSVVFMLETREKQDPLLQCSRIAEIHTISRSCVLTRHEQWNTRWIGYYSTRDDTVRDGFKRDLLDLIVNKSLIGLVVADERKLWPVIRVGQIASFVRTSHLPGGETLYGQSKSFSLFYLPLQLD
jgi:hypothetical protein